MTLKDEVKEIVKNARDAYLRGEITAAQYQDATRIPLKDLYLTREALEMWENLSPLPFTTPSDTDPDREEVIG